MLSESSLWVYDDVLRQRLLRRSSTMDSEMFWCCEWVVWIMLICDAVSLMAVITVILHYKGERQKSRSHHEVNKWWEMYFGTLSEGMFHLVVQTDSLPLLSADLEWVCSSFGWVGLLRDWVRVRFDYGPGRGHHKWVSLTAVLLLGPSDRPCFCLPLPGLITVTAIGRLSCVELLWVRFFQKQLM